MPSRHLDPVRRFRSTADAVRACGAGALALVAAAAAVTPGFAAMVRRAAISDVRLAAEIDGVLYLEVLASEGDSAESLARAYAGAPSAASVLRAANVGREPEAGTFYRLPFEALLNDHRRLVLSALYPEEMPQSPLQYASDAAGPYALYRLRPGEALYSAVVVRFCGRVDPAEVNALASAIATRSGIADMRRIPADHPVKIPLDLVAPEFLPEGAPERDEAEERVASSARHRLAAPTARLGGVEVILDSGHGGDDSGAVIAGVHEDEYAYDVMCRVRDLLLRTTAAQVVTTIRDRSSGYRPLDGRIRRDRDEYLLSDPPFDLRAPGATTTGVNMRPRIANQELTRLTAQGVTAERVVFISFHADSLHPAIRGTMVYVPGREHRRALPRGVSVQDLDRAEGLSRVLAREMVGRLRAHNVAVHPFLPIRDHVIRSGRRWVPAVLRVSRVPHSVLVEIANLNNEADRGLLTETQFRQNVASAVVEALTRYYAQADGSGSQEIARRTVPAPPP